MIAPNELRIGNYVNYPKYWGSKPIRVTGVSIIDRRDDETGIYEEYLYLLANDFLTEENFNTYVDYKNGVMSLEDIQPIPITEEILLKFGFEQEYKSQFHSLYYKNGLSYYFWYEKNTQYAKINGLRINVNCVHQLQNLFHSLTGEELKMK